MYIKQIFFFKERKIDILELGQIRCGFQKPQRPCHAPETSHVCGGKNRVPRPEAVPQGQDHAQLQNSKAKTDLEPV